jgi:hypothetical protein
MSALDMQVAGGLALTALLAWQLATGLRWIKLGRKHSKIHKWSGVTLAVFGLPHLVNGLYLAGWIKF